MKKGIGLNPNNHIHLTDHLAPLSVLMDMPLLLTDNKFCEEIQPLYPGLEILLVDWEAITPRYLIENFDILFQSELWNRRNFYSTFQPLEKEYQKTMRNVHCPHGFSDKLFWFRQNVLEDILLVYGDNMLDMFKELGIAQTLNTYVRTGNYRYLYYLQHQPFFDRLAEEKIWSRFTQKNPTILYAPTCNDKDENTSFLTAISIFENLPSHYNLVVKLHPVLEETDAPMLYHILGKYEKKKNIVFVQNWPLVYPILARSDLYIGDMSSVGYDFLAFNRPMFFLNQRKRNATQDRNAFLYRCGVEVMPEQYGELYSIIEMHLLKDQHEFTKTRSDMYHYTFGEQIPPGELKAAMIQSFSSPKKFE